MAGVALFLSLSLPPLSFLLFSASSSFRFFSFFSFPLLLFSALSSLLLSLLFSLLWFSPVFIGKKQGTRHGGAATVGRPLHYRSMDKKEASGRRMVGVLLRKKMGKKVGEKWRRKKFFSPVLCVRREEDDGAV